MDAGEMHLCLHLLQLVIITYTYYLLRITLRIGLQFQCRYPGDHTQNHNFCSIYLVYS